MSISAAAKTTTTPANVKTDTGFCSICPSPTHPPATFRKRYTRSDPSLTPMHLLRNVADGCVGEGQMLQKPVSVFTFAGVVIVLAAAEILMMYCL